MASLPIDLFLNIEQGPKAGRRLECKAAAISTVGRGRANTLKISRDSGISQKHVCFQWRDGGDDDDAHGGWTVIDAGSSNGTLINGVLVEPHKGIYIHTGDLIKIGSETTIRVEILGVVYEGKAIPNAKDCSKRKGTCIASESHGKGMPVIVGRHARKAGRAAVEALAAQEHQGKQLDVVEGEVYHGNHHIHNGVEEGHGKRTDDMTDDEVHRGKQYSNNEEEGHGKQQDEMADAVFSGNEHTINSAEGHGKQGDNLKAYRNLRGKHAIKNEADGGQDEQGCITSAYEHLQGKHGTNDVGKGTQDYSSKAARGHENDTEIVAASADTDLRMTVEQWFQHLMEEGPKYLYKVSDSIIQDIMLESKRFDEYVLSLS